MTIRWLQESTNLGFPMTVATAQAVERMDLVSLVAGTIVRAEDTVWASAIVTPVTGGSDLAVADTTVALSGGLLTNAGTSIKISYQFPWGEGALSAAVTATPTAHAALLLSGASLPPPAPALWTNIYVETAAGSTVYKLWGVSYSGSSVLVDSYGTGHAPVAAVNTGALDVTQYNFAQAFAGIANQRKVANLARIFGNSSDNLMMVNRRGIFEADCASATWAFGDPVAPAKDTGNTLTSQTVVKAAGPSLGIGRCVQAGTSITKVIFEIVSSLTPYNTAILASLSDVP